METQNKIHSLRRSGYRIRVTHYRYDRDTGLLRPRFEFSKQQEFGSKYISEKGGKTVIEVTAPDGFQYTSEAVCSKKDNFSRRLGLDIALGRVIADIRWHEPAVAL